MKKVSLKEQIEKVENQTLSGIYSKEDVLALLNDVEAEKEFDIDLDELKNYLLGNVENYFNNVYNAADYIEDPEFEISYGNELTLDRAQFDSSQLATDVDACFDDALTEYKDAEAAKRMAEIDTAEEGDNEEAPKEEVTGTEL